MACLVCKEQSEVGCLCSECAKQVPTPEGLIPEHIFSMVSGVDAEAWLVDGFGQAHAVAPRSVIGRRPVGPSGLICVLTESASKVHAELKKADGAWSVRDMGSRNFIYVDGTKVAGRAKIPTHAVLRIGPVPMWFLTEIADEPVRPESVVTKDVRDAIISYHLAANDGSELRLIGNAEGGSLLQRQESGWGGGDRSLPPLEYQLLRMLCARAIAEADSQETARGCVSTRQLANDLDFRTRYANEENVRQAVRRLRVAFAEIGIDDIVDVRPGRGYFMNCRVTVGGQ